jgi:hypothetical protein
MGNFEMPFLFEGRHYIANVSVLHGHDHLQYTILPQDEDLRTDYPTQVIHEFPGKPLQAAFPGASEESTAFADAILAGLKKFLQQAKAR